MTTVGEPNPNKRDINEGKIHPLRHCIAMSSRALRHKIITVDPGMTLTTEVIKCIETYRKEKIEGENQVLDTVDTATHHQSDVCSIRRSLQY